MTTGREWLQARRARTRLLIEYGGLVVKAGLPDLLEDDRATLFGGLLWLLDQLAGLGDEMPATVKQRWRRRGLRAFDADAAVKAAGNRGKDRGMHPE